MKRELWLDLEETVIDNWFDQVLLHNKINKIKQYIDNLGVKTINIWSFAIWHNEDKETFVKSGLKETLEDVFNKRIIEFPSIEETMKVTYDVDGYFHYDDMREWVQINGKFLSFFKYAKTRENVELYLIDDCVEHTVVHFPNKNVKIYTLNIDHDL